MTTENLEPINFTTYRSYKERDLVMFRGNDYICLTAHYAKHFNPNFWEPASIVLENDVLLGVEFGVINDVDVSLEIVDVSGAAVESPVTVEIGQRLIGVSPITTTVFIALQKLTALTSQPSFNRTQMIPLNLVSSTILDRDDITSYTWSLGDTFFINDTDPVYYVCINPFTGSYNGNESNFVKRGINHSTTNESNVVNSGSYLPPLPASSPSTKVLSGDNAFVEINTLVPEQVSLEIVDTSTASGGSPVTVEIGQRFTGVTNAPNITFVALQKFDAITTPPTFNRTTMLPYNILSANILDRDVATSYTWAIGDVFFNNDTDLTYYICISVIASGSYNDNTDSFVSRSILSPGVNNNATANAGRPLAAQPATNPELQVLTGENSFNQIENLVSTTSVGVKTLFDGIVISIGDKFKGVNNLDYDSTIFRSLVGETVSPVYTDLNWTKFIPDWINEDQWNGVFNDTDNLSLNPGDVIKINQESLTSVHVCHTAVSGTYLANLSSFNEYDFSGTLIEDASGGSTGGTSSYQFFPSGKTAGNMLNNYFQDILFVGASNGSNVVPADVRFYAAGGDDILHNYSLFVQKLVSIWGNMNDDQWANGLFPATVIDNGTGFWNNKYAFDLDNVTSNVDVDSAAGGSTDYINLVLGADDTDVYYVRLKINLLGTAGLEETNQFMVETSDGTYMNMTARRTIFTRSSTSVPSAPDTPVIIPIPALLRLK